MMLFKVFALFVVILIKINDCAPADGNEIILQASHLQPNGDYDYKYVLNNGAAVNVNGKSVEINGNQVYRVTGSYWFELNDRRYTVEYVADENGFRSKTTTINLPEIIDKHINPKAIESILG